LIEVVSPRAGRSGWTQARDADKETPVRRCCWHCGSCPRFHSQSSSVDQTRWEHQLLSFQKKLHTLVQQTSASNRGGSRQVSQ